MLVRMASVGVDAEYLRNLQSSGFPRMGLEDVIRMRAVGVDPSYIRDMSAALHTRPSIEQLTQLRALGVDPAYVRSFAQLGYGAGDLPETERAARENLCLPLWGGIGKAQQSAVVSALQVGEIGDHERVAGRGGKLLHHPDDVEWDDAEAAAAAP